MWNSVRLLSISKCKSVVMIPISMLLLIMLAREVGASVCYQCDAVDVANSNCSTLQNCTGKACVIYEQLDGTSTSTFCVFDLPVNLENKIDENRICWLDPDKKGKHCICGQNMCNRPRHPSTLLNDPATLPISNATLVKKNPLIDYDDAWDDDDENQMNAKPLPGNLLFPNAADSDPRITGDDSRNNEFGDSDLVPIDNVNYEYEDDQTVGKGQQSVSTTDRIPHHHHLHPNLPATKADDQRESTVGHSSFTTTENLNSGKCSIPPVFLLFFSSVAAVARLFS